MTSPRGVGKAEKVRRQRGAEPQHVEGGACLSLSLLSVTAIVLCRWHLHVIFDADALGIAVAVRQVDDTDDAAGRVDALHQAARSEHFVVWMRRHHQQPRVAVDRQHRPRCPLLSRSVHIR